MFPTTQVVLIKNFGEDGETRQAVRCAVVGKEGYFPPDVSVEEGDVVEVDKPRRQLRVAKVLVNAAGLGLDHIQVKWGDLLRPRVAALRRVGIEGLHPRVVKASSDLFTDGHYADAIFAAVRAVELRVRELSGLAEIGESLMGLAFSDRNPTIDVSVEQGQSGESEQRGFKFLFMGAMAAIRNPKAHENVDQRDPQRTLEYLAFASLLMRRLDDAEAAGKVRR